MSKWISKDLFENFQKEKIEEKDTPQTGGFIRSDRLWQTPNMGTTEQAKVYEGRFVPDQEGKFYKKFLYHFWQSGETWKFVLCPKTHNFANYCPVCSAVSKLYNGTNDDKKQAYFLKRKEKFVGNFYVVKDPRDEDRDKEKKVVGKIKIYEFPSKVEQKLKNEITDREQGYGMQIFDPSKNGRNFIIKVLSTKKDENGKQWPDYSSSTFSRNQEALGTDEEINALMETCVNLTNYITSMEVSKEKVVEILKSEFLWDLVETECVKNGYIDLEESGTVGSKREEKEDVGKNNKQDEKTSNKEEVVDSNYELNNSDSDDDLDDSDLLAELDAM